MSHVVLVSLGRRGNPAKHLFSQDDDRFNTPSIIKEFLTKRKERVTLSTMQYVKVVSDGSHPRPYKPHTYTQKTLWTCWRSQPCERCLQLHFELV